MQFLTLKVGDSDIPGHLATDGTCNKHLLPKVSLNELLSVELYARLQGKALLPTLQEIFQLLGEHGNGAAALEALKLVHGLIIPTHKKYASHFSLSEVDFEKRCRNEQRAFLDWLIPTFWKLRLYNLYRESPRGGYSFLKYGNPLKELKHWVAAEVAKIWSGKNDAAGRNAFRFLCNCVDPDKFFKLAINLENKKFFSAVSKNETLLIEPDDVNAVIQEMRKVLPGKLPVISTWLKSAQRSVPWEIRKFLGHAYINAGGAI